VAELHGIENSKKVIDLGLALVDAGVKIAADGKVDTADLQHLPGIVLPLVNSASAIPELGKEWGDLSVAESSELIAYVGTKLALPTEKAQKIAMASLKLGAAGVELIVAIRS